MILQYLLHIWIIVYSTLTNTPCVRKTVYMAVCETGVFLIIFHIWWYIKFISQERRC